MSRSNYKGGHFWISLILWTLSLFITGCPDSSGDDGPTPPDSSVSFYGNLNETTNSLGMVIILGRVQNTGSTSIINVNVKCDFYDNDGNIIGSAYDYAQGYNYKIKDRLLYTYTGLKPGEVGIFKILSQTYESQVTSYHYEISFDIAELEDPEARLVVVPPVNTQPDRYGDIEVFGTVRNTGTCDLVYGKVHVTFIDSEGLIIGTLKPFIDGEHIYAYAGNQYVNSGLFSGHTGVFEFRDFGQPFSDVAEIEVRTEWDDNKNLDANLTD